MDPSLQNADEVIQPHVIHALKCFEYYGEGYALVMPHYSCGDLYAVEANTKFSLEQKREVTSQLLDGLQYLHKRNLIHRDLKPSNVLVRAADPVSVVIIDFGQVSVSHPITYVGTMGYRAPEIKFTGKNHKQYTNAVDIFSLGMLILWLLTPEVYQAEIPYEELWSLRDYHDVIGQHIETAMDRFYYGREELDALVAAERMTRYKSERRPSAEKCRKLSWLTPQRADMPPKKLPTRRSSRLPAPMNSSRTQHGRVQKLKAKADPIVRSPNLHAPMKAPIHFGGVAAGNSNNVIKQEDFKDAKDGLKSMEICG